MVRSVSLQSWSHASRLAQKVYPQDGFRTNVAIMGLSSWFLFTSWIHLAGTTELPPPYFVRCQGKFIRSTVVACVSRTQQSGLDSRCVYGTRNTFRLFAKVRRRTRSSLFDWFWLVKEERMFCLLLFALFLVDHGGSFTVTCAWTS